MADPIKIRATVRGDETEIRLLLQHPMETGQRRAPDDGRVVPAHFIRTCTISSGSRILVEAQLNTAVARNPLMTFRTTGIRSGDRIRVHWIDNLGKERSDEVTATSS